jgi:cell division protein FtsB
MKRTRSGKLSKIIILAFIIYGGFSFFSIFGRTETARDNLYDVRRLVAEQELINAELEYAIENYDDPDVIADIARAKLGLVMPGEVIFYTFGSESDSAD